MPTVDGQQQQANEIATRLARGESVQSLATEYGLSRITIWRRNQQGNAELTPDLEDVQQWRQLLTDTLTDQIVKATDEDDRKSLVALVDRVSKLNGFDHNDRLNTARLKLDEARIRLMGERMGQALESAGIPVEQRRAVLEALTQ